MWLFGLGVVACVSCDSVKPGCGAEGAPAGIFSGDGVHRIAFSLSAEARLALDAAERPEVHAEMSFDGLPFPDVGLRLKGSGSYETMAGKPAFNVDLNQWVRGTRLDGLKAFRLHTGKSWDPTRTREWLSYELARAAGLLAPRVGFAWVEVDGQPYGIYVLVEKHDDVLIAARSAEQGARGVILEPAGVFQDLGVGALAVDGERLLLDAYDEGPEPPDPAVLATLLQLDAALASDASEESAAAVFALVERESFLRYLAWEAVARHQDGYRGGANWRLFVDGDRLRVEWVASGADSTWGYRGAGGATVMGYAPFLDPQAPVGGRALRFCMGVPSCRHDYARHILSLADLVEALDLLGHFDRLSGMLGPCIESDPKPLFDQATVAEARASTRSGLTEGLSALREAVWLEYPALAP